MNWVCAPNQQSIRLMYSLHMDYTQSHHKQQSSHFCCWSIHGSLKLVQTIDKRAANTWLLASWYSTSGGNEQSVMHLDRINSTKVTHNEVRLRHAVCGVLRLLVHEWYKLWVCAGFAAAKLNLQPGTMLRIYHTSWLSVHSTARQIHSYTLYNQTQDHIWCRMRWHSK